MKVGKLRVFIYLLCIWAIAFAVALLMNIVFSQDHGLTMVFFLSGCGLIVPVFQVLSGSAISINENELTTEGSVSGGYKYAKINLKEKFEVKESLLFVKITQDPKRLVYISKLLFDKAEVDELVLLLVQQSNKFRLTN